MQRRDFLKSTIAAAAVGELGIGKAQAKVPAHNWGNYDFGPGPTVNDRLNQGPFPQYPPDAVIPTDDVVMTTTSTEEAVSSINESVKKITDFIDTTSQDMRNHVVELPFGTYDAYQVALIIGSHTNRHTQQIEEVKSQPGFPKN